MAYRSDLDALEARHRALEAEVAERTKARDDVGRMLEEARARDRDAMLAADWATGGPARRRRRMLINVGVVIGAVLVLGIGLFRLAQRPSDREVRMERVIAKFERFTDQICACKDTDCTNKVMDEMSKWGTEMAKEDHFANDKPDAKAMARVEKIAKRMTECMTVVHQQPQQPQLERP